MKSTASARPIARALLAACLLAALATACASGPDVPDTGAVNADRFLYDAGAEALEGRQWLRAREYFRRLVDTYPQSPYRADAKLGIGDTYLGEGRVESLILAANEFREFLSFYPLNPRADYAQYRLALAQVRQMHGPRRDQTATYDALTEIDRFLENGAYQNSALRPEVVELRREVQDTLSEHEMRVGIFYYRTRWYPGAVSRLQPILENDPGYTMLDEVLFYLAQSHIGLQQPEPAVPLLERIVQDYPESQFVDDATDLLETVRP